MRFLANENLPAAAVTALRSAGHDVVWVRIVPPGTGDLDVLARAAREERILLTFDKDFGELAKPSPLLSTCGVVLLRVPVPKASDVGSSRWRDHVPERLGWPFLCPSNPAALQCAASNSEHGGIEPMPAASPGRLSVALLFGNQMSGRQTTGWRIQTKE